MKRITATRCSTRSAPEYPASVAESSESAISTLPFRSIRRPAPLELLPTLKKAMGHEAW